MAKETTEYTLPNYLNLEGNDGVVTPEISQTYVPGMGLGATKQATRWAYLGYKIETEARLKEALALVKRKTRKSETGGAPYKKEEFKMDNQRALLLWLLAREYPENFRRELTNRKSIQMAKMRWTVGRTMFALGVADTTNEQSVSRGKAFWGIDKSWNSKKLEEFYSWLLGKKL